MRSWKREREEGPSPRARSALRPRARPAVAAVLGLGLSGIGATGLPAQEDFRSAEAGRPTLVEDAVPLAFREWEFEAGARGTIDEAGGGLLATFEVMAGLLRNGHVGIEVETGLEGASRSSATSGGIEAVTVFAFRSLWRETSALPAVAVRLDVSTPGTGSLGHDGWRAGLLGLATRSLGRLRFHGNGGYTVAERTDADDYWRAGLGADYPLGLFSRSILADIYAEIPVDAGRTRLWAELGTRLQLGNRSVLDLGLATRLDRWDAGAANVELVVGITRVFGAPGRVRVGPYPDPTLR